MASFEDLKVFIVAAVALQLEKNPEQFEALLASAVDFAKKYVEIDTAEPLPKHLHMPIAWIISYSYSQNYVVSDNKANSIYLELYQNAISYLNYAKSLAQTAKSHYNTKEIEGLYDF